MAKVARKYARAKRGKKRKKGAMKNWRKERLGLKKGIVSGGDSTVAGADHTHRSPKKAGSWGGFLGVVHEKGPGRIVENKCVSRRNIICRTAQNFNSLGDGVRKQ